MTLEHTVKQGEGLTSIAQKYGVSFEKIWNDPENDQLKRKRKNPNILYPGDVVYIPYKETKEELGVTETKHRFKLKKSIHILRLAVEVSEIGRMANEAYELTIDNNIYKGITDADGMIKETLPADSKTGRLKVGEEVWELCIGWLNPIDRDTKDEGLSGAQGRLTNLGYLVGPVSGMMDSMTEMALKYFQADEGLELTGKLDEATRNKLVKVHGC